MWGSAKSSFQYNFFGTRETGGLITCLSWKHEDRNLTLSIHVKPRCGDACLQLQQWRIETGRPPASLWPASFAQSMNSIQANLREILPQKDKKNSSWEMPLSLISDLPHKPTGMFEVHMHVTVHTDTISHFSVWYCFWKKSAHLTFLICNSYVVLFQLYVLELLIILYKSNLKLLAMMSYVKAIQNCRE